MNQPVRRLDLELRRLELHKQENAARSVPYISFILTHVALVLFLIAAFFIDHVITNATVNMVIKIALSVVAVIFLASEWAYAISSSRRWKKSILIYYQLEQEHREAEEIEMRRQQGEVIALEQLKNRALQFDLQRLRQREQEQLPTHRPMHSFTADYPQQGNTFRFPDQR